MNKNEFIGIKYKFYDIMIIIGGNIIIIIIINNTKELPGESSVANRGQPRFLTCVVFPTLL